VTPDHTEAAQGETLTQYARGLQTVWTSSPLTLLEAPLSGVC